MSILFTDANAVLIESWQKDDETFYETKGAEHVYDQLKDRSCIVVTSNVGYGKTATIRHIALNFQSEGYEIVPIETPDDIIKSKTKQKQLFLIDDVLGKYDLCPNLLDRWERRNERLISCLETELSSMKILCTLRLQIARQKRFENASTILNKVVINLEHESYTLSKEEKQNILIKHIERNNLKMEEVEIMCKSNYAFPLLCKLVSNDEERFGKRLSYFRQPLLLFREELDKISNENKKLYCILVICMLYNGSFRRSIFDFDSNECDGKIYRIMQTCGLQRIMSKKEFVVIAVSAIGSYFVMDNYSFRFINDALKDVVGTHFFYSHPKEMCLNCDISFIRDKVRVHSKENMNENIDENSVYVQEDMLDEIYLKPLFDRLTIELTSERLSNLLTSHLFKNRNFVDSFRFHFERNHIVQRIKNYF
ncbi:Hypothetical predicted protein [Mytilus galloprovincialis]|uniref:Novel STAND NTPase 3 domain-containing protein n=1 Tax=Mytilus galloprovincialis TaxID=29158 RepID=A0A8B6E9E9_MYTGA|nr:Hypothetical predicted protein [Mytilus galloprovincialis]